MARRSTRNLGLLLGFLLLFVAAGSAVAQNRNVFAIAGTDLGYVNLAVPALQVRVPITGVTAGQTLVGLDFRPATGELYTLGYNFSTGQARLYTLAIPASGPPVGSVAATAVGPGPVTLALGNSSDRIGFDFNPTVDRIRVISTNRANFRLNPNDGSITASDGTLTFANPGPLAGETPFVGAGAYTNSFIGAASTTLYDIDIQRSRLLTQTPANAGTLIDVAAITTTVPITPTSYTDIDIYTDPMNGDQVAYLSVTQNDVPSAGNFVNGLYRVNLTTGAINNVGGAFGPGVGSTDIAIQLDRTAPTPSGQLLYAVNTNSTLLSFYSNNPEYILSETPITGITAGQTLVGTDFRPNNGQLIGLGYDFTTAGANTQVYSISRTTGVATAAGPAIRLELGGTGNNIGFDFNPTVDRLRVVSTNRADFRLNPNNGALAATDGTLTYNTGDPNQGATPRVGSVAYTNSYAGTTGTTLYDIDEALSILATQAPPNNGTLNTVGNNGLNLSSGNALVDLDVYFDKMALTNTAFLAANPNGQATSNLYTLNLATGAPTQIGRIGLGIPVIDIAAYIAPLTQPALTGNLVYAVAGGNLITFDSGNPSNIRSAVNVTGLQGAQVVAGLDFRPANGMLYVLGYDAATQQGQIYTIDLTSGALTAVSTAQGMALGGDVNAVGFDFNPAADAIRIVSATTQTNLRYIISSNTLNVDGTLTNTSSGTTPMISGAAYDNNDNNANTSTTLYGYDQARNFMLRANNPNMGFFQDLGTSNITVNAAQGVDLDIYSDLTNATAPVNSAFLAAAPSGTTNNDMLYSVSLTSGAASMIGRIGQGSNLAGMAIFLTMPPVIAATDKTWDGSVSTAWSLPANWTPTGVPTATDNVLIPDVANDPVVSDARQVNSLTLGNGATLTTANLSLLTLNGNFVNNGGTVLGSGSGEVRFSGPTLQTISGTSTQFQNLTAGTNGVTLNAAVQVQQMLVLNGNLTSNGNLTLLSNATGTAHVVNNLSTAVVVGNVTVQRYINPSSNSGAGYRHYSSPVSNTTVADLATSGFTPVVNPGYNGAANPGGVRPYPTVFGYDETRVNTSGNPSPQDFDKGFFSPNSLNDPLQVTRGYTVNIPASETVDFVGTLNNGDQMTGTLTRGSQTQSGWHLRGNPFPSPIDWEAVARNNMEATVYVYRSTGQYAGTYSTYTAGGTATNGGTRQLAVGQGFFARVLVNMTGSLTFTQTSRYSTYMNPTFQRSAGTSPLVRLELQTTAGQADEAVVYFDGAATTGFDGEYDAWKLQGGSPVMVASEAGANLLAVNGLPALTSTDVHVPLRLYSPIGTHTLRATELQRLPAGTYAYLQDALTGTTFDLSQPAGYSFTVANGALPSGRFTLLITQSQILATASPKLTQQVAVYPNPARSQVSIGLPVSLAGQGITASLVNALGQEVLRQQLPATGAGQAQVLPLPSVAKGVYTLRILTNQGVVNKRLVIE